MKYLTRDDVIRAGACADGVYEWANKHAQGLTVMPSALAIRKAVGSDKKHIETAIGLKGYGHGYGDGYGDGHGYGYDNGDGHGNGHGHGYGYDNGDGYGYGNGNGDGHGNGYGHGDGYGDGEYE